MVLFREFLFDIFGNVKPTRPDNNKHNVTKLNLPLIGTVAENCENALIPLLAMVRLQSFFYRNEVV